MMDLKCCNCSEPISVDFNTASEDEVYLCESCGTSQVIESDWTGRDEETDDSFVEYWTVEAPARVIQRPIRKVVGR